MEVQKGDTKQVKKLSGCGADGPSQGGRYPCGTENQASLCTEHLKAFCCPLCPSSAEGCLLQAGGKWQEIADENEEVQIDGPVAPETHAFQRPRLDSATLLRASHMAHKPMSSDVGLVMFYC